MRLCHGLSYDVEEDLDAVQKYKPRCFKTHAWLGVPDSTKCIFIFRKPCAAFYSAFNFFQGKYFQAGDITLNEFVKFVFLIPSTMRPNYFDLLLSWWPKRNNPNVLFLLYEDMLENLENAVRAVASFMGIEDETNIKNAVKMSRFDFMKKNQDKFSASHLVSLSRNKSMELPEDTRLNRIHTGSATKGRKVMDDCTKEAIQRTWTEIITKELGFIDYEEFRHGLKTESSCNLIYHETVINVIIYHK